ncbi:major facilitator superfamily domain-containing protein [Xylariomycetidae sp. FL2044]|nr:major facilitator superfamily domain-containing protein [Xylariomycetidae sp. FL2044]
MASSTSTNDDRVEPASPLPSQPSSPKYIQEADATGDGENDVTETKLQGDMPATAAEPCYSVFAARDKRVLTAVIGVTSLVSPLSANIYLPLLPLLQVRYAASAQAVNLTLTLYVVVAAVVPLFAAPAADTRGRRPVALATCSVFALASLALFLHDVAGGRSYAVLLLMRALQALGAGASASITYGVVSDVCLPAERGRMIGPAISASNLGLVLGPVLGGLIAWRSLGVGYVFLALGAFGVLNLVLVLTCLPETARNVVGKGDGGKRLKASGIRGWLMLGPRWHAPPPGSSPDCEGKELGSGKVQSASNDQDQLPGIDASLNAAAARRTRFRLPNPFSCLAMVFSKHTSILLWLAGCNYAVWYCVAASWPRVWTDIYKWSELGVGLAYLPSSLTIMAAGFIAGPWMDARYRRTASEEGLLADGHDVVGFPIERARLRQQWPVFVGTHIGIAGIGWAVDRHVHPAVLLVVQAITGYLQALLFLVFNTLLVDVHSDRPSTASAAASLVRSGLSGVGVATLQPIVNQLGWGWYFTLLALSVGVLQGLGMMVLLKKGRAWRDSRIE